MATTDSTKPVCMIVLGMAGSGKTTFVNALLSHLNSTKKSSYAINLDPAVYSVPYEPNIDIRDSVKFKEVMKQYGFGPNGAIMTSLNMFASQFDRVIDLVAGKGSSISHVVLDTPGQIEASSFPTIVVYVMDTPRSHNPVTFMSNMLYACSVLYKMRLPFIIVFNKTDIIDCEFAIEWMRDFEAFQEALSGSKSSDMPPEMEPVSNSNQSPYMTGLVSSMSLVLDEFYKDLQCCGVSSVTGEGMDRFIELVTDAIKQYHEVYLPAVKKRLEQKSKSTPGTSRSGDTLIDLLGNDDQAEQDPMANLDGVELAPRDDSDASSTGDEGEGTKLDDQFRRRCTVTTSKPK